MVDDGFYRAFEERHRGSRELIKSRLAVYLPFIQPLKQFYKACQGIDLGCGRGEWLELMQESGFDVKGVDLDEGMLAVCRERGYNVHTHDAVGFLKKLPEASQVVVSGFHIVEHLPFSDLQMLVQEALRVLKPGGLLILETPNPENIVVGTADFYLDPTHQRPIPSQLLSFLSEYYGFEKVKALRLQEPVELSNGKALTLFNVLNDASPDYAIVAQKAGEVKVMAALSHVFEVEYGITLHSLAMRYDRQAEAKAQQAEAKVQQVEAETLQVEAQAEARVQQVEAIARQAEAKAQQAEAKVDEQGLRFIAFEAHLIEILGSTSWRLTMPLRMIGDSAKSLFNLPGAVKLKTKEGINLLLTHASGYINSRSKLRKIALFTLRPFPALKERLKQPTVVANYAQIARPTAATELANLTSQARRIYSDIKSAIEQRRKVDD